MRQAYFGRKSRKLVQGEDMKKDWNCTEGEAFLCTGFSFLDFWQEW